MLGQTLQRSLQLGDETWSLVVPPLQGLYGLMAGYGWCDTTVQWPSNPEWDPSLTLPSGSTIVQNICGMMIDPASTVSKVWITTWNGAGAFEDEVLPCSVDGPIVSPVKGPFWIANNPGANQANYYAWPETEVANTTITHVDTGAAVAFNNGGARFERSQLRMIFFLKQVPAYIPTKRAVMERYNHYHVVDAAGTEVFAQTYPVGGRKKIFVDVWISGAATAVADVRITGTRDGYNEIAVYPDSGVIRLDITGRTKFSCILDNPGLTFLMIRAARVNAVVTNVNWSLRAED